MKFVGTYTCGYCGCDEYCFIEADTLKQAEEYMQNGLIDYAETWEYMALDELDLDELNEDDSEEIEDALGFYYENCGFDVREATEDEAESETFDDIRGVG